MNATSANTIGVINKLEISVQAQLSGPNDFDNCCKMTLVYVWFSVIDISIDLLLGPSVDGRQVPFD